MAPPSPHSGQAVIFLRVDAPSALYVDGADLFWDGSIEHVDEPSELVVQLGEARDEADSAEAR
jgi:hypothetical protein